LVIYRLQNTKRCIIRTEIRRWLPDSRQKPSGEPGAIQEPGSACRSRCRDQYHSCMVLNCGWKPKTTTNAAAPNPPPPAPPPATESCVAHYVPEYARAELCQKIASGEVTNTCMYALHFDCGIYLQETPVADEPTILKNRNRVWRTERCIDPTTGRPEVDETLPYELCLDDSEPLGAYSISLGCKYYAEFGAFAETLSCHLAGRNGMRWDNSPLVLANRHEHSFRLFAFLQLAVEKNQLVQNKVIDTAFETAVLLCDGEVIYYLKEQLIQSGYTLPKSQEYYMSRLGELNSCRNLAKPIWGSDFGVKLEKDRILSGMQQAAVGTPVYADR